jgi:hypothetical protein
MASHAKTDGVQKTYRGIVKQGRGLGLARSEPELGGGNQPELFIEGTYSGRMVLPQILPSI